MGDAVSPQAPEDEDLGGAEAEETKKLKDLEEQHQEELEHNQQELLGKERQDADRRACEAHAARLEEARLERESRLRDEDLLRRLMPDLHEEWVPLVKKIVNSGLLQKF